MHTKCLTCQTRIDWWDCPTGGWWAHAMYPADGHDAVAMLVIERVGEP